MSYSWKNSRKAMNEAFDTNWVNAQPNKDEIIARRKAETLAKMERDANSKAGKNVAQIINLSSNHKADLETAVTFLNDNYTAFELDDPTMTFIIIWRLALASNVKVSYVDIARLLGVSIKTVYSALKVKS